MKLVITIDLPNEAVELAPLIEDRIQDCVQRFAETVHVKFGVYRVRLLSDRLYTKLAGRIYGWRSRSGASAWVRWLSRATTVDDD